MDIIQTKLPGVLLITPMAHGDNRGFFMESYNRKLFSEHGLDCNFVQDNHSLSAQAGTVRGLHYQEEPKAQTKLVRVLVGAIYDVAVDIRTDSPTYGKWVGVILSAENKLQLLIPKGFAHGFCTLVADTEVLYKVDEYYSPEHDRGIFWGDHTIGIDWPVSSGQSILSDKDRALPSMQSIKL